jgi:hypothetical protein
LILRTTVPEQNHHLTHAIYQQERRNRGLHPHNDNVVNGGPILERLIWARA